MMSQYDRLMEDIERQVESGRLTRKEANEEIREIDREFRADAKERAQEAFDREMEKPW